MKIAVLGLGYVGAVSAACLADQGHDVVGVDINPLKVDMINAGRAPIVEDRLESLIAAAVDAGSLRATTDAQPAVAGADVSLICVGTPGDEYGQQDLQYVRKVAAEIGLALRTRSNGDFHVVAMRSTVLPGTIESLVAPIIEECAFMRLGEQFGVAMNPEFMREGSAIRDYFNPPYTVIGASDERTYDTLAELYAPLQAPIVQLDVREAEMLKFANNSFHALKVCFANEIGALCKQIGIDSHRVMDAFVQDTQLNISARYLRPGFAFGGSCLPKDVRAIAQYGRKHNVELPLLQAIMPSNERQIERAFRMVRRSRKKRIGILGLSFKAGTDDLRESPLVRLAERLLGKGYQLRIYDENVLPARMVGSNKRYIESTIPHLASLLVGSVDELLHSVDVLIIGNGSPASHDILSQVRADQEVIDLVRLNGDRSALNGNYHGIGW